MRRRRRARVCVEMGARCKDAREYRDVAAAPFDGCSCGSRLDERVRVSECERRRAVGRAALTVAIGRLVDEVVQRVCVWKRPTGQPTPQAGRFQLAMCASPLVAAFNRRRRRRQRWRRLCRAVGFCGQRQWQQDTSWWALELVASAVVTSPPPARLIDTNTPVEARAWHRLMAATVEQNAASSNWWVNGELT